jgi:hypothetical protein
MPGRTQQNASARKPGHVDMTIDMAALENLRRDHARQRPRRATCDDGQMLGPQEDVHLVADGKRSKRGGRRLDGNIADHYCPVKSRTNSACTIISESSCGIGIFSKRVTEKIGSNV